MLINDLFVSELPDPVEDPFPNIYSNSILNTKILDSLIEFFPLNNAPGWFGHESIKMFMGGNSSVWPDIGKEVFDVLESDDFCLLLSNKFNTPKLYPTTIGGGYQTSEAGSSLDMHIDAQMMNDKYRWINLHIYLNKNWNKFHGGELLLINTKTHKKTVVTPEFGTIIIYKSGVTSLHGHPSAWFGKTGRRGISVYYFAELPMDDFNTSKIKIPNLTDSHIERLTRIDRTEDDLDVLRYLKYK